MVTWYPSKWREAWETSTPCPETVPITLRQVWSSKVVLDKSSFLYHTNFSPICRVWIPVRLYKLKYVLVLDTRTIFSLFYPWFAPLYPQQYRALLEFSASQACGHRNVIVWFEQESGHFGTRNWTTRSSKKPRTPWTPPKHSPEFGTRKWTIVHFCHKKMDNRTLSSSIFLNK